MRLWRPLVIRPAGFLKGPSAPDRWGLPAAEHLLEVARNGQRGGVLPGSGDYLDAYGQPVAGGAAADDRGGLPSYVVDHKSSMLETYQLPRHKP